jgi:hypothetical protein
MPLPRVHIAEKLRTALNYVGIARAYFLVGHTYGGDNLTGTLLCVGCEHTTSQPNRDWHNGQWTRRCVLNGVNLFREGTYSAPSETEEGYGNCKVTIPGQPSW